MNINAISAGIDEGWINLILENAANELAYALKALQSVSPASLCPNEKLILHAFRLCKFSNLKCVLIGQDPYISRDLACGLSFSVPTGAKIPPSLINIYKSMKNCGAIKVIPDHGNLEKWVAEGVLLFNSALTTISGLSNAHKGIWHPFARQMIRAIAQLPNVCFILLGESAANYSYDIPDTARIFKWGHPSPQNHASNFAACDVWIQVNKYLNSRGIVPINWELVNFCFENPRPQNNILYIFTDGAATKNGTADCRASWAYVISAAADICGDSGLVTNEPSNNRGELQAIVSGIAHVANNLHQFVEREILIVSDSQYSLNSIFLWYDGWMKKNDTSKKNLDLISAAVEGVKKLRAAGFVVNYRHVRSHIPKPADNYEAFLWEGNNLCDAAATTLLQN